MAFLSLLDDRARPKGSRDPLGFEMVWTHFGRKVVGNLTTITSSWKIFSVGLLGFHWCNQLCSDAHPVDKQRVLQEHFIRYEQLAAFLRCCAGDQEIMGITRVNRRLGEQAKTIQIGTEKQNLILSDQISYGIWGLYSTALRASGLLHGDNRELTDRGIEIVRMIEAGLDREWFWNFIRGNKKSVSVTDLESVGKAFIKVTTGKKVKNALITALLSGSGEHQNQLALYEACHNIEKSDLEGNLPNFVNAIQKTTTSDTLRQALDDVNNIERLLVVSNNLFSYCRRKDGAKIAEVAEAINKAYHFNFLPAGPRLGNCPYASDLEILRENLRQGQTEVALRCLLAMNKKIMAGRGGAAWVEEDMDGKLRVRVNAERASLEPQKTLETQWDYDYFLGSYARIAAMENV